MNNFHVLLGFNDRTMKHFVRDNRFATPAAWRLAPWSLSADRGVTGSPTVHVSMVVSGYGNLEAVVATADGLLQHWIRQPSGQWILWATIVTPEPPVNAPSLVQGTYRAPGQSVGNLELVVPIKEREFGPRVIAHFYQDNRDEARKWYGPTATFGGTNAEFVALIQGDYGDPIPPGGFAGGPGNLECVVVSGGSDQMQHWWRDQNFRWNEGVMITDLNQNGGAAGNPAMATFGSKFSANEHRDFEVVVPTGHFTLAHYTRKNQLADIPWVFREEFATNVGVYPALVCSPDFSSLEVVDAGLHYRRDANDTNGGNLWSLPIPFAPNSSAGSAGFVQGNSSVAL